MNGFKRNKAGLDALIHEGTDIILLQETHFTFGDNNIYIQGYKTFESTSSCETRRGVAILIKDGIIDGAQVAWRHKGSALFITGKCGKFAMLIGSIHLYYENATASLKQIEEFITQRTEFLQIIGGDFNIDISDTDFNWFFSGNLLPSSDNKSIMSNFMRKAKLCTGRALDDFSTKDEHVYDYILFSVAMANLINYTCVRTNIPCSDHCIVQAGIDICIPEYKVQKYIPTTKLKEKKIEIIEELNTVSISSLADIENVISEICEQKFVTTTSKFQNSQRKNGWWFTGELNIQWKKVTALQKQYQSSKDKSLKKPIANERKILNNMRKEHKNKELIEHLTKSEANKGSSPKAFFQLLKKLNGIYNNFDHIGSIKTANGEIVFGNDAIQEVSNNLMMNIRPRSEWHDKRFHTRMKHDISAETNFHLAAVRSIMWPDILKDISIEELIDGINRTKNGKAPGRDGFRPEMLHIIKESPESMAIICNYLNDVLNDRTIPESWSIVRLVPVPKKGDLQLAKNWRGIALLSIVYKLFAGIIAKRLQRQLVSKHWLAPEQHGFLPERSTIEAAGCLVEILQRRTMDDVCTHSFFLDVSAAYDSVHIELLKLTLHKFGLPMHLIQLLATLYATYKVTVEDKKECETVYAEASCGVRQGCSLAPTLFIMTVNDLIEQACESNGIDIPFVESSNIRGSMCERKKFHMLMYADDAVVCCDSPSQLQTQIEKINSWLVYHGMKLNGAKSLCMVHGKCKHKKFTHEVEGVELKIVDSFTYLGLTLGKRLIETKMAQGRVLSLSKAAGLLKKSFMKNKFLSISTKMNYEKAMVLCVGYYGVEIWTANRKASGSILHKIGNMVARTIGVPVTINHILLLLEVNILPPEIEGRRRQLRFLRKILQSNNKNRWSYELLRTSEDVAYIDSKQTSWLHDAMTWATSNLGIDVFIIEERELDDRFGLYLGRMISELYPDIGGNYMKYHYKDHWWMSKLLFKDSRHINGKRMALQLRTNQFWLSKNIRRINGMESDRECIFCGQGEEDVTHLLHVCANWQPMRSEFVNNTKELIPIIFNRWMNLEVTERTRAMLGSKNLGVVEEAKQQLFYNEVLCYLEKISISRMKFLKENNFCADVLERKDVDED